MPQERDSDDSDVDFDLKAMELAEFEKKVALGEDTDEDSEMDLDLDNRKKGKLKRKSKVEALKLEKKQKLSKLNNSRFMSNKWEEEDFTKDDLKESEVEAEAVVAKPKKAKKSSVEPARNTAASTSKDHAGTNGTSNSKLKILNAHKRPIPEQSKEIPLERENGQPKKVKMSVSFSVEDEWSKPLEDGEEDLFFPSRKNKVKEANSSEVTPQKSLIRNPFSSAVLMLKKVNDKGLSWYNGTPPSAAKRVVIALNKNETQQPHEYIKQLKDSPNMPFDSEKRPKKSVLKANVLPSPINPYYQKKMGMKPKFNDTL